MLAKTYLRYQLQRLSGLIVSPPSNIVGYKGGKCILVGALEVVNFWNIRTGNIVSTFHEDSVKGIVTRLCFSPKEDIFVAGYSDGSIRFWDVSKRVCVLKFNGHTAEITALCFDSDGSHLASGSKDTDIVIWDVIAQRGLFRLRGHKNVITDVKFLQKFKSLVSSSKDSLVKAWDLDTQHCYQTIVGNPSEVWSFDINKEETRLVSLSSDDQLRVYTILSIEESKEKFAN